MDEHQRNNSGRKEYSHETELNGFVRNGSEKVNSHALKTFQESHNSAAPIYGTILGGINLSNPNEEDRRNLRLKILKNVLVLSFGFLFLFTAFQSLSNLQSSVNSDEGLGTASLSVIYAALIVSCLFVPSFMISWLGLKCTIITSMLMYTTYMVANFYASWYTLIPTSIVLGLGGAPLWTAKCAYLTELAKNYASLTSGARLTPEAMVTRFFGVFFMIFQSSQIWGNLISSYILAPEQVDSTTLETKSIEVSSICGSNFCNEDITGNNTNLKRPPEVKIYTLIGVYSACSLLAALLIFLLMDPMKRPEDQEPKNDGKTKRPSFRLLVETFRHLKEPYQLLLIPLTIYSGLEQAYIAGDFTKAFVSCSWGIHNVGFTMICFGTVNAICSFGFGHLMKIVGRVVIFVFGGVINIAMVATMFKWTPNLDEKAVFFVIAGLWGMADAIWQTQINTLYGILFTEKNQAAAFANYRLWESLGFIVAFAYNNYLCVHIKLWILSTVLVIGMLGYLSIEIHLRLHKRERVYSVNT